jgi:hypothetical protein
MPIPFAQDDQRRTVKSGFISGEQGSSLVAAAFSRGILRQASDAWRLKIAALWPAATKPACAG